ncbi:hypothetical protein B484DRAFT_103753 [Ochromonadaceae sp. CCMP2298]|nr:hypothetical protein B484DRAFT_103753 [Ochromonadaceae sp. CCMP2298]
MTHTLTLTYTFICISVYLYIYISVYLYIFICLSMHLYIYQGIHESNQRRFRIILLSSLLLIVWVTAVFGTRIRKAFTEQTAFMARETLENESLKVQTQELATAVVNTILEDREITSQAAAFLKKASTAPETQQALLELTLHVLQHPETLEELTNITQKMIKNLADDKDTIADVSRLLGKVLEDPQLQAVLVKVIGVLCKDEALFRAVAQMMAQVFAEQQVVQAGADLLSQSGTEVMRDEQVLQQSRAFVGQVMGDDLLQKEGGNAIWKSITYALQPGIIR